MKAKGTLSTKRSLTNLILLVLEKSVDSYVRFEDFTTHYYRYHYGIPELKKSSLAQALRRLRENGLVELIADKELMVRLTDEGRDRAIWTKFQQDGEKWDKRWRLVIWDVPEKRRLARDLLRYKLKQLGFKQWQKSVWASKINCTDILRDFIKKVGIEDWVMVIESDNIGI